MGEQRHQSPQYKYVTRPFSRWYPKASWITVLGAGVLAMPHAISQFGLTFGIIVVLFSGAMSGFGLYLQARCAKYVEVGTASFFALSQLTYPNAAVLFDGAIAIKCFGRRSKMEAARFLCS